MLKITAMHCRRPLYIRIDIGSATVKIAVLDENGALLFLIISAISPKYRYNSQADKRGPG